MGRKQDDIFFSEELSNATSVLEFPDIFDGRSTYQTLVKGQPLPNISARSLERFGTVVVKFTLKSWTVGTGVITAILQEIILIDKNMRPTNLQQSLDTAFLSSGAQDSTSTRCALGTSSRVLRMLTESGDVIRYVFLLSAGFRQDILDVGGGSRPVFSSWEFVRFGGQ